MNKQESDILNTLLLEPFINQRILAEESGHSLGVVNRSLKELIKMSLTWMNNGFICKDLYAPFVLEKDLDYIDDLKKKYKIVLQ